MANGLPEKGQRVTSTTPTTGFMYVKKNGVLVPVALVTPGVGFGEGNFDEGQYGY